MALHRRSLVAVLSEGRERLTNFAAVPRASTARPCARGAKGCSDVEKALHREPSGRGCTAISVQDGGSEGSIMENDDRPADAIQVTHAGRR